MNLFTFSKLGLKMKLWKISCPAYLKIPTDVKFFPRVFKGYLLSGIDKYTAGKQAVSALKSVAQTEAQSKHP